MSSQKDEKRASHMAMGMCLGICFGLLLGRSAPEAGEDGPSDDSKKD